MLIDFYTHRLRSKHVTCKKYYVLKYLSQRKLLVLGKFSNHVLLALEIELEKFVSPGKLNNMFYGINLLFLLLEYTTVDLKVARGKLNVLHVHHQTANRIVTRSDMRGLLC